MKLYDHVSYISSEQSWVVTKNINAMHIPCCFRCKSVCNIFPRLRKYCWGFYQEKLVSFLSRWCMDKNRSVSLFETKKRLSLILWLFSQRTLSPIPLPPKILKWQQFNVTNLIQPKRFPKLLSTVTLLNRVRINFGKIPLNCCSNFLFLETRKVQIRVVSEIPRSQHHKSLLMTLSSIHMKWLWPGLSWKIEITADRETNLTVSNNKASIKEKCFSLEISASIYLLKSHT